MVLEASPAASAALSRRCMQHILHHGAKIKKGDLSKEIDAALSSNRLSADLADQLDAVRTIGNFAAHPTKSAVTSEIIAVEPGEASWNLDVIEGLMDAYYVLPARATQRKTALNKKLIEAGKTPLP